MRLFPLLLMFWAFTASLATAQTLDDKLSAYFPFSNCDGADQSGNGSSGALQGSVDCVCGVRDNAIRFDGDDDAVYFVGNLASVFTTSDFTVSFYIKPGDLPGGSVGANAPQLVMSKQEACGNQHGFWVRYVYNSQSGNLSNTISSGLSENDSTLVVVSSKLDNDRCWQHIVLVREGPKYSMYVNGRLRSTQTAANRIDVTNQAGFKLGEPVCPTDRNFTGEIDELRLYNKAQDADAVNKLLNLRPDRIVNGDTLIYLGNSFVANTTESCADSYFWQPATGVSDVTSPNPTITPVLPTWYEVSFVHPDGCLALDSIFVNVIDPDTLDCEKIFLPNAFTPGSSAGRNDVFGISNPFAVDEFISFEIFDRWGGRVFNAEAVTEVWDGQFGGKPCNPGVFLYRLRYKCKGAERVKGGTLTLLR